MTSDFTIAVHSLVLLAYKPDHMATSEFLAESVCTHPARVRRVLAKLGKNGFVKTKEGIGGGYVLNCDPQRVTLDAIYRLMSTGGVKPHWCSGNPKHSKCVISSNMQRVMDNLFASAEEHLLGFFRGVTIQLVLDQIRAEQGFPDAKSDE